MITKYLNNFKEKIYKKDSHFNLANIITFSNILVGFAAIYFISIYHFKTAIFLAWIGGLFDILDGKIARKYNLSNDFGIQLDSYADFLTFVIVPAFLILKGVYSIELNGLFFFISFLVSTYYIISGLRRLILFNINSKVGIFDVYFNGIPTPLGGILLWLSYLLYVYLGFSPLIIIILMILIAKSLNSNIKVKHL